jgi:hypothetical protein
VIDYHFGTLAYDPHGASPGHRGPDPHPAPGVRQVPLLNCCDGVNAPVGWCPSTSHTTAQPAVHQAQAQVFAPELFQPAAALAGAGNRLRAISAQSLPTLGTPPSTGTGQ